MRIDREMKKDLHEGESLLYTARQHWVSEMDTVIEIVLSLTIMGLVIWGLYEIDDLNVPTIFCLLLILLYRAISVGIGMYVHDMNVLFITTDRIRRNEQHFLFNQNVYESLIDDVKDVEIRKHGIVQHLLNYGTLVITIVYGETDFVIEYVHKPEEVADLLKNLIHEKQ